MKKISIFSMALFTGAFAFVACNNTQSAKNPDSEKVASEANDQKIETNTFEKDADALVKLASQGHYLSAAAGYAINNANQKQVKTLANTISADHHSMASEISALASKKNYQIPDSMSNEYVSDVADMKNWKKGKEFDTKFVNRIIDEHEKAIKILENCTIDTKDADLKTWCEKHLPGFRSHLEESRKVKEEIESVYKS